MGNKELTEDKAREHPQLRLVGEAFLQQLMKRALEWWETEGKDETDTGTALPETAEEAATPS